MSSFLLVDPEETCIFFMKLLTAYSICVCLMSVFEESLLAAVSVLKVLENPKDK